MAERHEHGLLTELRAVDAALAPLKPSRELDERIDALLAGGAPHPARRRVALAGLGVCAAAAAFALFLGRGEADSVAAASVPTAHPALDVAPAPAAAAPSAAAPAPLPTSPPTSPPPAPAEDGADAAPADSSLALARRSSPAAAPAWSAPEPRAADVVLPAAPPASDDRVAARRAVKRGSAPDASLVARPVDDSALGPSAELEAALASLRADKARGDLRGAVARIDELLQSRPAARVVTVLRLERARLQERLGDPAAACASLAALPGDEAHDARARLACP